MRCTIPRVTKPKKRWLALLVAAALIGLGLAAPALIARVLNRVLRKPPYHASAHATELHRRLFAADLHSDALMWNRDLLVRGRYGHLDVPRMLDGNLGLEVFEAATRVPWNMTMHDNPGRGDVVLPLFVLERRPIATWTSLTVRALYEASLLRDFSARSGGRLVVIRSAADLQRYLELRQRDPNITAGLLGIEGAQALDGKLSNLDALYDAGFRVFGLAHFYDNEFAGSAHGYRAGLTDRGRRLIREMERRNIIVDLAHSSPQTIADVLAMAQRPVLVSHTGVQGVCNNIRNLSDDQLRGIARTGGIIGIGFWDVATCGRDADAIARSIRYTADLVGVDHVALGSDFDGSVTEPFDASGLVLLTDALVRAGFSDADIEKIMGGNALRFFLQNLPEK